MIKFIKKIDINPLSKIHSKPFINFFFIWVAVLLLISSVVLILQCKAKEANRGPNVLGRAVRLDDLCDDFEDTNWYYDYDKGECYRRFWRRGSGRGEPKLLKRVTTPRGGKVGSAGALEIRTNKIDSDSVPTQEDLLTVEYKQKLGHKLTRAHQPVFLVRIWVPPFDQWGDYYSFGFRHETCSNNNPKYYPSIWLTYNKQIGHKPFFKFRIGTGIASDVYGGSIEQDGWWTVAIAFDEKGIGHYYTCPGVDIPSEKNEVFDTTRFITVNSTENPSMDDVNYSFFTLGYPSSGNTSPRFRIDDYEIWVAELRE